MKDLSIKRSNVLDIVKGFAIINIILIHTVWWSGTLYIPNEIVGQLALLIDVPLFFFLSGWAVSLHEQTLKSTLTKLFKLYIPYIVMMGVLVLFLGAFWERQIQFSSVQQWLTLTFSNSFELPVVMGSMWFMIPFVIISLFTPLMMKLIKNRKVGMRFIVILLVVNVFFDLVNPSIANIHILDITYVRTVIFFALFYFLGMYTRDFKLSSKQFIITLLSLSFISLIYLWGLNFKFELQANKFPPSMFYFVFSMFSIMITLYLKNHEIWFSKSIKKSVLLKFLRYSGVNVFNIYLYQGFGASFIYYLIYSDIFSNLPWFILLPICFVCNMIISYLLAYIFGGVNKAILSIKLNKRERIKDEQKILP